MERTMKNNHYKKVLAFILVLSVLLGMFSLPGHKAYAAQQNFYHDSAEHWSAMLKRVFVMNALINISGSLFVMQQRIKGGM